MKSLLAILIVFSASLVAQTTTVSASTNITDRQGNLMSGSICWETYSTSNGVTAYNATAGCFSFTAGAQASYSIPNGTYSLWINEASPVSLQASPQGQTLFQIPSLTVNGTTLTLGSYFNGQFGLEIGSAYYYWQVGQASLAEERNGNAVVLPGSPLPGARAVVKNVSATAACTVTADLGVAAISGSTSIAAGAVWHVIWSGDQNTWIVE